MFPQSAGQELLQCQWQQMGGAVFSLMLPSWFPHPEKVPEQRTRFRSAQDLVYHPPHLFPAPKSNQSKLVWSSQCVQSDTQPQWWGGQPRLLNSLPYPECSKLGGPLHPQSQCPLERRLCWRQPPSSSTGPPGPADNQQHPSASLEKSYIRYRKKWNMLPIFKCKLVSVILLF